jgi:hypothetical protein
MSSSIVLQSRTSLKYSAYAFMIEWKHGLFRVPFMFHVMSAVIYAKQSLSLPPPPISNKMNYKMINIPFLNHAVELMSIIYNQ